VHEVASQQGAAVGGSSPGLIFFSASMVLADFSLSLQNKNAFFCKKRIRFDLNVTVE